MTVEEMKNVKSGELYKIKFDDTSYEYTLALILYNDIENEYIDWFLFDDYSHIETDYTNILEIEHLPELTEEYNNFLDIKKSIERTW